MLSALLLVLLPLAAVQDGDVLRDADFEFSIRVPPGMALVPEQEAVSLGLLPRANVPRAESPGGKASHSYVWRDTTGGARELRLLLEDNPPPFTNDDKLVKDLQTQLGIAVDGDKTQVLHPPHAPPNTLYVEGTRQAGDGLQVRHCMAYYLFSRERFLVLQMFAPESTWSNVEPELKAALASIQVPKAEGAGALAAGRTRKASRGTAAAPDGSSPPREDEDWGTLEVTGSLVLAALLLFGLATGRRAPA